MSSKYKIRIGSIVYKDSNEQSLNQFGFFRGKSIPCVQ